MNVLHYSAIGLIISGICALVTNRHGEKVPTAIGCFGGIISILIGLAGTLASMLMPDQFSSALSIGRDAFLFALPILLVGIGASVHACGYLNGHISGRYGIFWFCFNLTLASMLMVTVSDSLFKFLLAWEAMGIFSFALVAFEYKEAKTVKAAWNYLLACQAGGLLIVAASAMHMRGIPLSNNAAMLFALLLLLAFGLKIGFPILHVWLPEAHPAAPAPVSAIMSGAMIPLGFCGIIKFGMHLTQFSMLGWILTVCGLIAAPYGILMASSQKNLKKLLAYSSVENMGIISLGIGLGCFGSACGSLKMEVLGYTGALLHIINHALLKGTLFLGAGSILRSTGTLSIDAMGGLWKKMPFTGWLFALSAGSLCGLPPGNGFIGELLIYASAFHGLLESNNSIISGISALAILTIAITGGLAAAVYAKIIGCIFFGEPRSELSANAKKPSSAMAYGMCFLTICSFLSILLAYIPAKFMRVSVNLPFGGTADSVLQYTQDKMNIADGTNILLYVTTASIVIIAVLLLLFVIISRSIAKSRRAPTWDCGYALPSSRMEYTGTGFVHPIMSYFSALVGMKTDSQPISELFPKSASLRTRISDMSNAFIWQPLYTGSCRIADCIHKLQSGSLHFYILLMLIALAAMLIWGLVFDTAA